MTSPSTGDWPTDPDDLALIAVDTAQPRETRERAFRDLRPTVRRVARRVAVRFAAQYSDDLLHDHRWPHLQEHVSDRGEPWDDWLTVGLAADFRRSDQPSMSDADRQRHPEDRSRMRGPSSVRGQARVRPMVSVSRGTAMEKGGPGLLTEQLMHLDRRAIASRPSLRSLLAMIREAAAQCGLRADQIKFSTHAPFPVGYRLRGNGLIAAWMGINGNAPGTLRVATGQYRIRLDKARALGFLPFIDKTRPWKEHTNGWRAVKCLRLEEIGFFAAAADEQFAAVRDFLRKCLKDMDEMRVE